MNGVTRLVLIGLIFSTGITAGCQQHNEKPRLDTSSQQTFISSLQQVRSQVDETRLKRFDKTIRHTLESYRIQKEYSLLPTSNPLNGLTAEEILELPVSNQRQSIRRLRTWGRI
ncbi:hypothetical protein [Kangiella sp.]|uniref:hypothetical protein n=1 Tax=Kangiella sp. TaxID=1920245 RepID=UPI00198B7AAD|nr:hypothetical protein [Kangiella sp.]MBD3653880.1 hypothetical protein [Kangiella sp.]